MSASVTNPGWIGGYHLLRVLGTGGSGTVWEAQDEGGARVALKLLHPSVGATEEARTRLLREARLVNQVPSERVAKVLDVEADAYSPFVVTELIEGRTLDEEIGRLTFTSEDAAILASELAQVLNDIHGVGIAHRDLKPSNIILAAEGPTLIDFGIAHGEGERHLTQTGFITGTPGYVSPELLSAPDNPSLEDLQKGDWYALAGLLLKSLTGRPPFGAGQTDLTLRRVLEGDPDVEGLSDDIQLAFQWALHSDPNLRMEPHLLVEVLRGNLHLIGESPEEAPTPAVEATRPLVLPPLEVRQPGQPQWASAAQTPSFLTEPNTPLPDGIFTVPPPFPLSGMGGASLTITFIAALAWLPVFLRGEGVGIVILLLFLGQASGAAIQNSWVRRVQIARGASQRALITAMVTPWRIVVALLGTLPGLVAAAIPFYGILYVGGALGGGTLGGGTADFAGPLQWLSGGETTWNAPTLLVWLASITGLAFFWLLPTSRPGRLGFSRLATLMAPKPLMRFLLGVALVIVSVVCAGVALSL